jgi:hypothetical protein
MNSNWFVDRGFDNLNELVAELEKENQEKGIFFNWHENNK